MEIKASFVYHLTFGCRYSCLEMAIVHILTEIAGDISDRKSVV